MIKVEFWHTVAACINFFIAGAGVRALSMGNTNTSVLAVGMFFVAGIALLIAGAVKVAVEEDDG